jgi:hypothetical protein
MVDYIAIGVLILIARLAVVARLFPPRDPA